MAFPTTIDSPKSDWLPSELPTGHSSHHNEMAALLLAIQTKIGIDGSANIGSIDYKIANRALLAGSLLQVFGALSFNVGNADTTISRVSAGVIAVGGDTIITKTTNVRYIDIYAIDKATDNAVGTNIAGSFECPFTGTIVEIGAYVETAGVTGTSIWDVNKNGTTIMTTNKLSIDSAEVSTRIAATAPTLTTTAVTAGDLLTIDTDSLSTTKPKGLHVRIGIRLT